MGGAGTALLDYAERIRYAHQQFGVRDFVVLMERGDVLQALCGSGNVTSQCLDPTTLEPRTESAPPPSAIKRVLRESSLAQYFASQLKVAPSRLLRQVFSRNVSADPLAKDVATVAVVAPASAPPPAVDAVAKTFFARIRPHVSGRLIIVVDADRPALMKQRSTVDAVRDRFMALARAEGALVVDTEPLFRAHYAGSPLSLDLSPFDGHFNPLGVRLVTAAMAKALVE